MDGQFISSATPFKSPPLWIPLNAYIVELSSKPIKNLFKMSTLQYFDYPGFGEQSKASLNYSQAVRIDNRIEISGQGTSQPPYNPKRYPTNTA